MSSSIAIGVRGDGLTLEPIAADDGEARDLGAAFAAVEPWRSYRYGAESLGKFFATQEAGTRRYKILSGSDTAGVAVVRMRWLRGPYLQFLGVLPAYQKRGVGSAVLDWFEALGRAEGERNIWVAVSATNAGAISIYERHGFARVAELDGLVQDEFTELLMRKRLA